MLLSSSVVPKRMASVLTQSQKSQYVIRFTSKKSLLPYTGVNICFVDKEGTALLHRLTYTPSPDTDCLLFTQDFTGPCLEEIQTIFVAPESDTWSLKHIELNVMDEDCYREYFFSYNDEIGKRGGDMAAVLTPIQKSTVDMKPVYDAEYAALKKEMLVNGAELTLVGATLMASLIDVEKGYAFAFGGTLGLVYIRLLQKGVDDIGRSMSIHNTALRLAVLAVPGTIILQKFQAEIHTDNFLFIAGLMGFMTYRIALLLSYIK